MIKTISNKGPLIGAIELPGDKSISHRAAILLSLSKGEARISNFATGKDCLSTLDCLKGLGVELSGKNNEISIKGFGGREYDRPRSALNCGNSGTTMRLLAGVLAGQEFETILIGDDSLSSRPMQRIAEPLRKLGAKIELDDSHAPIRIRGGDLSGLDYDLEVESAQLKSCILLGGLFAKGSTVVRMPESDFAGPVSRDHTERMLKFLGADLKEESVQNMGKFRQEITIESNSVLEARDIEVPSDISTAAFFLIGAGGIEGSDVTIKNVGLNPTRNAIIEVIKECGVRVLISNQRSACGEPRGDLRVDWKGRCELLDRPYVIHGSQTQRLIDEIPALAVLGTRLPGGLEVRDASELRIKESDRITAVVENLRAMKANVEEFEDGFRVSKSTLEPADLNSFGDHRIAMAFSIASLFAGGTSQIDGAECVEISYPEFFQTLAGLME